MTFASQADGRRRLRHGSRGRPTTRLETIEASLPALVSVTDQINEPRYPSFKGIMAAKKKPVETVVAGRPRIDAALVGAGRRLDEGRSTPPSRPPRAKGTIVTDEGDGGAELADFLADEEVRLRKAG